MANISTPRQSGAEAAVINVTEQQDNTSAGADKHIEQKRRKCSRWFP
jgi:hypothetical protein